MINALVSYENELVEIRKKLKDTISRVKRAGPDQKPKGKEDRVFGRMIIEMKTHFLKCVDKTLDESFNLQQKATRDIISGTAVYIKEVDSLIGLKDKTMIKEYLSKLMTTYIVSPHDTTCTECKDPASFCIDTSRATTTCEESNKEKQDMCSCHESRIYCIDHMAEFLWNATNKMEEYAITCSNCNGYFTFRHAVAYDPLNKRKRKAEKISKEIIKEDRKVAETKKTNQIYAMLYEREGISTVDPSISFMKRKKSN